ncbi:hypothetical protein MPH_00076 [Macrophomina phaseolina MS6]|uniref:Uncharacterized protein n=1 Tax=Macrophomina phaseolina (strain MS6) TaxID=1126212 RepID=K2S6Y7_MACPH|nr:hypothetical protein MPH_00076 [Macrophomina phaseolina MS6]
MTNSCDDVAQRGKEQVGEDIKSSVTAYSRQRKGWWQDGIPKAHRELSLLLVNKVHYVEANPLLYQKSTFCFKSSQSLYVSLTNISHSSKAATAKITLHADTVHGYVWQAKPPTSRLHLPAFSLLIGTTNLTYLELNVRYIEGKDLQKKEWNWEALAAQLFQMPSSGSKRWDGRRGMRTLE